MVESCWLREPNYVVLNMTKVEQYKDVKEVGATTEKTGMPGNISTYKYSLYIYMPLLLS